MFDVFRLRKGRVGQEDPETKKKLRKDLCSLQRDEGGCRGLTVYFRGH